MALPFEHPFTMILAGATGTGKTHFVLKLIDNMHTIIKPTPSHIVYYFMEDQPIFGDYPEVEFRHGTPTRSEMDDLRDTLVVFDDMMMESDIKLLLPYLLTYLVADTIWSGTRTRTLSNMSMDSASRIRT